MLILPHKTACLYCFLSSCETVYAPPVIGTTPGVIGVMQANEALKFLLNIKGIPPGVLILWDGITVTLEKCAVERDLACPVCGDECTAFK